MSSALTRSTSRHSSVLFRLLLALLHDIVQHCSASFLARSLFRDLLGYLFACYFLLFAVFFHVLLQLKPCLKNVISTPLSFSDMIEMFSSVFGNNIVSLKTILSFKMVINAIFMPFPARKTRAAQKRTRDFPPRKNGILDLPSPRVLADGRTLTIKPTFLDLIQLRRPWAVSSGGKKWIWHQSTLQFFPLQLTAPRSLRMGFIVKGSTKVKEAEVIALHSWPMEAKLESAERKSTAQTRSLRQSMHTRALLNITDQEHKRANLKGAKGNALNKPGACFAFVRRQSMHKMINSAGLFESRLTLTQD